MAGLTHTVSRGGRSGRGSREVVLLVQLLLWLQTLQGEYAWALGKLRKDLQTDFLYKDVIMCLMMRLMQLMLP